MCSTGSSTSGVTAGPLNPGNARASTTDCESLQLSASMLHVASGLYLSGGYAKLSDNNSRDALNATLTVPGSATASGDSSFWWIQGGWQAKLNPLGSTIFWGQYLDVETGLGVAGQNVQTLAAGDVINSTGGVALIAGGNTQAWSLGISQNIDAAAMTLYMGFHNYSTEGTLINRATGVKSKANAIDDMQVFFTGATIRF
jgi:hypothetical protein